MSFYLSYTNASPDLAMQMASIKTGTVVEDYHQESNIIYPLDNLGNKFLTVKEEPINLNDMKAYILGSDPLLMVAISSLYQDKSIGSIILDNFLHVVEEETIALPFSRIRNIILCYDDELAHMVHAKITDFKDQELWDSMYLEFDPNYDNDWNSIDIFIRKWFHEVSCFRLNMEAGTMMYWWVFRKRKLPFLNIVSSMSFILENHDKIDINLPIYYYIPDNNMSYPYIRLRYTIKILLERDPGEIKGPYFNLKVRHNNYINVLNILASDKLKEIMGSLKVYPNEYDRPEYYKSDILTDQGIEYLIIEERNI